MQDMQKGWIDGKVQKRYQVFITKRGLSDGDSLLLEIPALGRGVKDSG
jgi:hypothetical protein